MKGYTKKRYSKKRYTKKRYTKKRYTKKRYKKKKRSIKKKGKRSTKNKITNSQIGGWRQCPKEYPKCGWDGWCYNEEERDNESDNVGTANGKRCISSYKFSEEEEEEEEEARRRRRSLDLPYTATDEECELAERAGERRRYLGLPYTATDEECDAREALLERIKDISTRTPPGGAIYLGSKKPIISQICLEDPTFIHPERVIPFKKGDRIICARCDTDIDHLYQDANVIQCPTCEIHLTSSLNEISDQIDKCEKLWPPLPPTSTWECVSSPWEIMDDGTAILHDEKGSFRSKKVIPEKYSKNEYYFRNRKNPTETVWELKY
jgi:hypothetical protein